MLAQAPYLRPVYENVCAKLPCPGFYWTNVSTLSTSGTLREDPALGMLLPTVSASITNTSPHPQQLPILEVKVLDAAGDTLASRVLEPADYGFVQKPAILPAGETAATVIHFRSTLPVEAAGVSVRAVANEIGR